MRGLTLRLANPTATRANITDIPGVTGVGPGETIEVLYTDAVQQSLEYGTLNRYLTSGGLTATFVSGSILSRSPMGSTMVGATPTTDGVRGLVPTPTVADRDRYLKGDGTWYGVTALTIGAVPEAKLTTQGDLLFRGITTSERLPIGTLGQVLRSGVVNPQWQSNATAGLLASRPSPGPLYAGTYYWATDSSALYGCYYNGTTYAWSALGNAGSAWDTFPTGGTPTFAADITHVGRAAVGVSPASSIPAGIQFQVLGSSQHTRVFVSQSGSPAADQPSATQLRGNTADKGLYVKPEGYGERRVDLPGLTRRTIPTPEAITIPDGSQYLCQGRFTLQGVATLTLQGDSTLVVL